MNFLIRTFIFAAVMSLPVSTLTSAQEPPGSVELVADVEDIANVSTPPVEVEQVQKMLTDMAILKTQLANQEQFRRVAYGTDRKVFIIPASEIKKEDHLAIERDMHVMSHIFDRVLTRPHMIGGVFTVMNDFFGRDSHVTQVIYLDGYGALFFMEVNLPLLAPPESPKEKEPMEAEEQVDKIWKQAEQELFSPQELKKSRESGSKQEYDAEKVEALKRNLIEVLKHAANIQALKSDDLVILNVTGRASQPATAVRRSTSYPYSSSRGTYRTNAPATTRAVSFSPSVVTIRVKKADIDAFSKGELDFARFHERTQIITY